MPESTVAVSDEDTAGAGEEQKTVGNMTQEELRQVIYSSVDEVLNELLPKQLARQRSMLETELKWSISDMIKNAAGAGGQGAADSAGKEQAPQEIPKLNPSIDWSFLE